MADEPISALIQVSAPPFSSSFTNPSTGAMLEILDTTNTSMASTGTNSKVAPGDLLKGYLAAGSNITLTETSGIVSIAASGGGGGLSVGNAVSGGSNHATLVEDGSGNLAALAIGSTGQLLTVASGAPAWAAPVTATNITNALAANFTLPSTGTSSGVTLTLTVPGTYLIFASVNANLILSGTVGQGSGAYAWIEDVTNTVTVAGVVSNVLNGVLPGTVTSFPFSSNAGLGPFTYTPATFPATINLFGQVNNNSGTINSAVFLGTSGGGSTTMTVLRVA